MQTMQIDNTRTARGLTADSGSGVESLLEQADPCATLTRMAGRLLQLMAGLSGSLAAGLLAAQTDFTLEILAPRGEPLSSPRELIHILGRSTPGARVNVAGEPVTVYATGVFARDRVPLALGANRILVEATHPDGRRLQRTLEFERTAPVAAVQWPTDRLFLDGASLRPSETLRVAPGEPVEVAVRATPGQRVQARLAGQRWQVLPELTQARGSYRALLRFAGSDDIAAAPVQIRISAVTLPPGAGPRSLTALTPGSVGQWRADPERLFVVGADGADLLHGLHEVRLGGPNLAELGTGTVLQVTGQQGDKLRVQLAPDSSAWVEQRALALAPAGTPRQHAFFSSLSVAGTGDGDLVTIPLNAGVPYVVRAVADAAGHQQLEVELFNTHHATTWITHRASARVVRELSAEQAGPERVRVRIALHEPRLWGWRVERSATALRIVLRAKPSMAVQGSPLAGLRVALEAGHGGSSNLGAIGATVSAEKDVNRWTVAALKAELESVGALVSLVREGDDNPSLRERAQRVLDSQAQLFVSVHANASDTSQGFLRSTGVSTYYKHANGRDLAAAVQQRLLALTGLNDFGLVGNFNYAPIRLVTWAPAILVEQAFMSHPGDEAQLLDPVFRATLARAVRLGLEDFLRTP